MAPPTRLLVVIATLFIAGSTAPPMTADTEQNEWTQWRGPARDGVIAVEKRVGDWPEEAALLWEAEVGEGYSGPLVAGDRVWVHSRRGEAEVVSSLSLADGRIMWRRRYEAPFRQDHDALQHGRGPYATPALAGGRLFSLGVTSVLSVWDARSGRLVWRKDYSEEYGRSYPYFGQASSPLVWREHCFVFFGATMGEASDRGAMVALDVADGTERWRWDGDAPSVGASPVLATIDGELQLVFKTKMQIIGLDPATGSELWRIRYSVSQDNTILTPLFFGDQLVTSDWDKGMHSWMIEREDGGWQARKLWQTRDASIFTSSPVLIDGEPGSLVAGFSHFRSGQLFLMEPGTGRVVWRGDGRSGEHATLAVWGDDLLVFSEDGYLVVGKASSQGFEPFRRYRLGDSIAWTHPAFVDNKILVKDGGRLAVYGFG